MTAWLVDFIRKQIQVGFLKILSCERKSKSSKSMVLISCVLCTNLFFHKIWKALNPPKDSIFSHPNPFSCSPFKNVFSSGAAHADYEDFPPTKRAFPREIWLMSLTLIDIARYTSLIEQSCSCTIRYFDRPNSFCDLVTWPTTISDDTLAFLFNICNIANF